MPAYTNGVYTGDGSNTVFNIPFTFDDFSEIKVTVDGVETTPISMDSTTVTLGGAPNTLQTVVVSRVTNLEERDVDFNQGARLTEVDLDKANIQLFTALQEVQHALLNIDDLIQGGGIGGADGDFVTNADFNAFGLVLGSTLTSLGNIVADSRGVASGIAPLDSNSKVPILNLPSGDINGVAPLDSSGKVPTANLPSTTATGRGQPDGLAPLGSDSKLPSNYLSADVPLLNNDGKLVPSLVYAGEVNGVAPLDASGVVPAIHLPATPALGIGDPDGVAPLDSNSKVPTVNLPSGDVNGLAPLDANGKIPLSYIGAWVVATNTKGQADGVAPLDSSGKVPTANLPAVVGVGDADGIAPLDSNSKVPVANLPVGDASGVAPLGVDSRVPAANLPTTAVGRAQADGVAPLDSNSKVPSVNLPKGEPSGLAPLDANAKIPIAYIGDWVVLSNTKGQINGVAPLDSSGKVPTANLPATTVTGVGDANGIAPLDGNAKVPSANLPEFTNSNYTIFSFQADGVLNDNYTGRGYANGVAALVDGKLASGYIGKGDANGVAPLNGLGQIPDAFLPAVAGVGDADGIAPLDSNAKVPAANLPSGVANGIAPLDSIARVPVANLPSGVANGIAPLDSNAKVPAANLGDGFGCLPLKNDGSIDSSYLSEKADKVGETVTSYRDYTEITETSVLDWDAASVHRRILTADVTFTFANIPEESGGSTKLELVLFSEGGHAVTWPSSPFPIKWIGGVAPTLTGKDIIVFSKYHMMGFVYGAYVGSIL